MISIYVVLGLYFAIGALVYGLYCRSVGPQISMIGGLLLYGLSRLVPVFMRTDRPGGVWVCLAADLILTILVCRMTGRDGTNTPGLGLTAYLLSPVIILQLLSGQMWRMVLTAALVALVLAALRLLERGSRDFSGMELFPEYVCLNWFCFLIQIAAEQLGQSLGWLTDQNEDVPVLLLVGMMGCVLSVLLALRKAVRWEEHKRVFHGGENPVPRELVRVGSFTRLDWLWMTVLTLVFGLLLFHNLGSSAVPSSNYHMERGENHQLVLDLGEETQVARIDLYLGHQRRKTASFSYLESGEKEWTLHRSKEHFKTSYTWYSVDMDVTAQYLGVVTMDDSMDILEMVIVGEDGRLILPVNEGEHWQLFDEQELYPEYPTYYTQVMFDEIHHARTAYDYLYGPPFSETTHPPLGKILIAIGIWLFGMNPFGWRCVCALFGTMMVPLMYLFAWRISRKTRTAVTAAILLGTEFMTFVLARIATLDIIVGFFILLMFFLMYCFEEELEQGTSLKRRCGILLLCGCATGCAIATKWTGAYAAAGIAVIFFAALIPWCRKSGWSKAVWRELRILFGVCVVSFLVIPVGIYVLSYYPFARWYPETPWLTHVADSFVHMLGFHSEITFTHAHASEWYTWLWDKRPVLDAYNLTREGYVSRIATFGSPLVVWLGFGALVYQFYLWMCKRDYTARFLAIAYLAMLMPWWFIHRTVFLYQYFGCILILILMLVHSAAQCRRHEGAVLIALSTAACILFVMFYPILSGREVQISYITNVLKWLKSWPFG